jgi:hypothetical protein
MNALKRPHHEAPLVSNKITMKKVTHLQTLVQRGYDHADFCEDFLAHYEGENFLVCVIMDGCSSGTHGHFSSSLFGKLFNLRLRFDNGMKFGPDREPIGVANCIMYDFCKDLATIKSSLRLADDEILSTIVLAVYSKTKDKLVVIPFGDGYAMVNGEGYEMKNSKFPDTKDENGRIKEGKNMPNYIAYDLDILMGSYAEEAMWHEEDSREEMQVIETSRRDRFNDWFDNLSSVLEFENVNDFSISSDGINSFKEGIIDKNDEAIELLMRDVKLCGGLKNKANVKKKMNVLSFRRIHNYDDLALIRVLLEPVEVPQESVESKEVVQ